MSVVMDIASSLLFCCNFVVVVICAVFSVLVTAVAVVPVERCCC